MFCFLCVPKRTQLYQYVRSFLLLLGLFRGLLNSWLGRSSLLFEVDEHGGIEHLLRDTKSAFAGVCQPCSHHEEWVHHQHTLPAATVFVCAIHACARVTELARDVRMDVQALVPVGALGEEFALLSWVVVLALLGREVALGPVFTADLAFVSD